MQYRRSRTPISLAMVITELDVGGAERCLVNLATGLDRDRFAPTIYALGPRPAKHQSELVEQLAAAQLPVQFVGATSAWQLRRASSRLRALLAEQRPQLVQTFLFHANVLGGWSARRAGRPVVVAGIRVADPRRWRLLCERHALRNAARIVCVSDAVARFTRRTAHFPADKLVVIPNGIAPDQYENAVSANLCELGIADDRSILLFVGRLETQKGVDWLLRSAPAILSRLPQHELVLVGDGPLRHKLSTLTGALANAERIHFIGWRSDIPALLKRAELLVLPSRWEGMPNVVLEAMAAARPVVATRCEGVDQLLGDAAAQQTVAFGDDEGLLKTIARLVEHPKDARAVAQQNRQRVRDRFSLAAMIRRYEDLYLSLLDPAATGQKKRGFEP